MKLSKAEEHFLKSMEEARLATSHDDIPHVKPVSFILVHGVVVVATDYDTRAYKNIEENPNAGVAIDVYESGNHKAVCLQGKVEVIENGLEFERLYGMFNQKFEWVRREPWSENEAPFLKILPRCISSWGLE